jgi:predicted RNA binding protein YcfA (HicA-like mRNA interferase family)
MSKLKQTSDTEGNKDKKKPRICLLPKDYTWSELVKLLKEHGYAARKNGRTGGSRRRFINEETKRTITLHEPHPSNIVKEYILKQVIEHLGIC